MTARSPSAFLLSLALHAFVVGLAVLVGYATRDDADDTPKILELVAGEGDNYMAREAPALGTPGGIKLTVPNLPDSTPEPARPEPAPLAAVMLPAPAKVVPAPKAPDTVPNFSKQIKQEVRVAQNKAKREIARERAAEEKRRAAEEKRLAEEKKRLTKAEFDAQNKAKPGPATPSKAAPTKVAKIDAEGIAKGVVGGSTNNKIGGAGGRALVANHDNVLDAYYSLFKQRLRERFEPPPGLSDLLKVVVEVRSNADGSLSNARVEKSSGSSEFDAAVLDAIRRVRMPARPDSRSENFSFVFTMRERDEP